MGPDADARGVPAAAAVPVVAIRPRVSRAIRSRFGHRRRKHGGCATVGRRAGPRRVRLTRPRRGRVRANLVRRAEARRADRVQVDVETGGTGRFTYARLGRTRRRDPLHVHPGRRRHRRELVALRSCPRGRHRSRGGSLGARYQRRRRRRRDASTRGASRSVRRARVRRVR